MAVGTLASASALSRRSLRLRQPAADRFGEIRGGIGNDKRAARSVSPHYSPHRPAGADDHRPRAGHGFENRQPEGFNATGVNECRACAVRPNELGPRNTAEEPHIDAQLLGLRSQLALLLT